MKTRYSQISQITQTVTGGGRLWVARGIKTDALGASLRRLCNLQNLRSKAVQENP